MGTKSKYRGGRIVFYDDASGETVFSGQAIFFEDDFVTAGAAVPAAASPSAGYPWVKKIVGAAPPTVAVVANAAGGQMAATLTAASEKQDAAIYMNDSLQFDATKNLVFECRANLSVLPSAAQVQMVWGVQSAWIDGPDNASFYAGFGVLANGAVLIRTKDGVTTNALATGITVAAGEWHSYQMDMTDPTNVIFSIDGLTVVTASPVTFAATGSNAIMQPYAAAYKASGTGVGTLTLDMLQARANR